MADYTEKYWETHQLLGHIHPATYTTEQNTGYFDCSTFHRLAIVIHSGVLAVNLDIDIEQATDTAGAGAKTFNAGTHDTLITATTDNDTIVVIDVSTDEFDVDGGFDCLNVECTPAGQSNDIFSVEVWGIVPRFAAVPTTALHATIG